MTSESVIWEWLLRGLGGLTVLVERNAKDGPRIGDQQVVSLTSIAERLLDATSLASVRSQQSGAPQVDPEPHSATIEATEKELDCEAGSA